MPDLGGSRTPPICVSESHPSRATASAKDKTRAKVNFAGHFCTPAPTFVGYVIPFAQRWYCMRWCCQSCGNREHREKPITAVNCKRHTLQNAHFPPKGTHRAIGGDASTRAEDQLSRAFARLRMPTAPRVHHRKLATMKLGTP